MRNGITLIVLILLGTIMRAASATAEVDCSLLDPRASVSTEKEGKITASVNTLFKIAKAGGSVEGKIRNEVQNLQRGAAVTERSLIELRTLYLFCGMVANAKDITTDRKVELFNLMMKSKEKTSNYPVQKKKTTVASHSKDRLTKKVTKPDSIYFEDGWITYHRFQLNKEKPMPFEVGSCPGADCYRFSLGPRETEDSKQIQTIFLEGGGFEKHLEKLPGGGFQLFRLARLDSKGGSYGIPIKQGGHITARLGLFKGASLRLNAIDNDVLFVVEDDRINYLTVGVAIYDGTFCKLYREGKTAPREIPECAK